MRATSRGPSTPRLRGEMVASAKSEGRRDSPATDCGRSVRRLVNVTRLRSTAALPFTPALKDMVARLPVSERREGSPATDGGRFVRRVFSEGMCIACCCTLPGAQKPYKHAQLRWDAVVRCTTKGAAALVATRAARPPQRRHQWRVRKGHVCIKPRHSVAAHWRRDERQNRQGPGR